MLRRRFRLRTARDFARLRQDGRLLRHPALMLSLAPNGLDYNRYGFITSKTIGNAVIRNHLRRLLSESIHISHQHLLTSFDVVLIARPALVGQRFAQIQRIVKEMFERAELWLEET